MKHITLSLFVVLFAVVAACAQSGGVDGNHGHDNCLWAGLSVNEPVFHRGSVADAVFSFALMNDCPETIDAGAQHWRLVINGEEQKDSDLIFSSNTGETNNWGPIHSGGSRHFTRTLALDRYFPTPGIYKVSWRGDGFESPEVTIRVVGKAKLIPAR